MSFGETPADRQPRMTMTQISAIMVKRIWLLDAGALQIGVALMCGTGMGYL